jgi:hypothetical protein
MQSPVLIQMVTTVDAERVRVAVTEVVRSGNVVTGWCGARMEVCSGVGRCEVHVSVCGVMCT